MDSVSVKYNIHEIESTSSQLFFAKGSRSCGPVKSSNHRFLDFKQVVHSLSGINIGVGSSLVRSKGPDFSGLGHVPTKVISKLAPQSLRLHLGIDLTIFNRVTQLTRHGFGFQEETVMFVCGLRETGDTGFGLHGLTVRYNWVGNLHLSSHEILLKILQTNFQVKFSGCRNDVFTRFASAAYNHRIRLCQTFHTLNQLGEISGVLRFHCATHDRRHRELHCLNSVGIICGSDSSRLQQILINTNQGADVSSWYVGNLLGVFTHHDQSTLNVLYPMF
mmetsp:Transcript_18460/g.42612  ORF Transcript_18460/g.42612 Transcript_18460/m.42612 type:complete len:276 (+) Transcript_18460:517-1344(+)